MSKRAVLFVVIVVALVATIMTVPADLPAAMAQSAPDSILAMDPAPPLPAGWVNVFAGLPAGATITVGMELPGTDCKVSILELGANGWLIRTAAPGPAYVIGNYVQRFALACKTNQYGLAAHGDQDWKGEETPTRWVFVDGVGSTKNCSRSRCLRLTWRTARKTQP